MQNELTIKELLDRGISFRYCMPNLLFLYLDGRLIGLLNIQGLSDVLKEVVRLVDVIEGLEEVEWLRAYREEDKGLNLV